MARSVTFVALAAASMLATACASSAGISPTAAQTYVEPITGSAPIARTSPLAGGFQCVAEDIRNSGRTARIAVSQIKDDTGKFSYEGVSGGASVTQGGALMAMRAVGMLGLPLVERYDTRIADAELALARQALIRDGGFNGQALNLRDGAAAGRFEGSDYYITGSITEFNSNIQSGGGELEANQIGFGARTYIANVVVDLRLVRTADLMVIGTPVTIEKQIRGYETRAGIFNFFGDYLIDLNMGSNNQEPVQLAVRSALELAVLELAPRTVGASFDRCREYTNVAFDNRALHRQMSEPVPAA